MVERSKRPRKDESPLLGLAQEYPQIFERVLFFLDQTDKDNLALTCRFFFEKETKFRPNPSLGFYFEKPQSLPQNDKWRCGYFTLYNAFKVLNFLKEGEKSFLSLFRFVSSNLNDQGGFDEFLQRLFNLYELRPTWFQMFFKRFCSLFISEESHFDRSLVYAYSHKKSLWGIQFEDAVCKLFKVENVNNIINLFIILLNQFEEWGGWLKIRNLILQNPTLFGRKKTFENTKIPQVVVIKGFHHWNLFIVTEIGVLVVDSYFDFKSFDMIHTFREYAQFLYNFFNSR